MTSALSYPIEAPPAPGTLVTVAPGVAWLRMPLPFALDHINLWLLEDGDGWTLVDTGIADDTTRALWESLFAGPLVGRPIRRVFCTHFHPDHMGLAGWLETRIGAPLWATLGEWAFARMLWLEDSVAFAAASIPFYRRCGLDDAGLALVEERGNTYARRIVAPPQTLRRIQDGEEITIGTGRWRVIVSHGHAPEHAALWNREAGILISGDQVLPAISPNVSVWPTEPLADPLAGFLASLGSFAPLPPETLVLPSHGRPFYGLHARLEALAAHHQERLDRIRAACATAPHSGCDLVSVLFRPGLDTHQLFFALGEAVAHAHWLEGRGALLRETGADGVDRFIAPPDAAERSP